SDLRDCPMNAVCSKAKDNGKCSTDFQLQVKSSNSRWENAKVRCLEGQYSAFSMESEEKIESIDNYRCI
ncbi:hypothetical protein PFISCL1PPCAC_1678, partial [Pristionchus fissidentatus]